MRQILLAMTFGTALLSVAAPARAEDHRIYGVEHELERIRVPTLLMIG